MVKVKRKRGMQKKRWNGIVTWRLDQADQLDVSGQVREGW